MAAISAASNAVRGTIEPTSRYSPGEWSRPPIGPRPSIVGTPIPAVVFASEAPPVAASRSSNPIDPASAIACPTSRPERASFSIGQWRPASAMSTVTSGTVRGSQAARIAASASTSVSRVTARQSTSSVHRSATTFGRVPPAITPTLTVTPGQRPLSAWSSVTIRAASRIALRPFSGSTPAWAARPLTVITSPRFPFRDDTMSPFARAHSSTRHASTPGASARMCGVDTGEPISSSGLATNTSRASGRPPVSWSAAIAYSPASSPLFMSVTPGPLAMPSAMANGRSAAVPGSNTVSRWPMSMSAGPSGSPPAMSATTVSPRPWSLGWVVIVAPRARSRSAVQAPTSSTPALVYEPQSMPTRRSRSAR